MKHLQILTDNEEQDLRQALEAAIDFRGDTLCDEVYYSPEDIRRLASKSDEEIRKVVNENARAVNENLNRLERLQALLVRLNNIVS